MKVETEPLKRSKLISQCKNWQTYGHTQRIYKKEPRYVKCADKHHTQVCKKKQQVQNAQIMEGITC